MAKTKNINIKTIILLHIVRFIRHQKTGPAKIADPVCKFLLKATFILQCGHHPDDRYRRCRRVHR